MFAIRRALTHLRSTPRARFYGTTPHSRTVTNDHNQRTFLQTTISNNAGSLANILNLFRAKNVNLFKLESKYTTEKNTATFLIGLHGSAQDPKIKSLIDELQENTVFTSHLSTYEVPKFAKCLADLDELRPNCIMAGVLSSDHPGFNDPAYRERRNLIADIAFKYKSGEPIPRIEYTKQEQETWRHVFNKLMELYPTHTCLEYQTNFPQLVQDCGFHRNNIPQLQDVADFLFSKTGFTLQPVAGLLSNRDFLSFLALRVFPSTQYIRHHSKPDYTPEPDICHDLIGHVPLLADADFADFSQMLGLSSLGVSDEAVEQLIRCYWYTVEFGLVRQRGKLRAYGAGLLSSFGELQHCLSSAPEVAPLSLEEASHTPYPITTYQPKYYVVESFAEMKEQLKHFSQRLERPFNVTYNKYTRQVQDSFQE